MRFHLGLWLMLSLAVLVQTIAAESPRDACFEQAASDVPAMHMDCHDHQASNAAEPPPCCGDSCPDMAACAAAQLATSASTTSLAIEAPATPDDAYLLPRFLPQLWTPFRPPTNSRA